MFTPHEWATLASLRGPRAAEWAASRVAAKECVRRLLAPRSTRHAIEVRRDPSGVPWALVGGRRLPLSLAHSGGWAVAASHVRLPVGVDVEPLRRLPDRFSRYFLSRAEEAALEGWEDRPTASMVAWTVKEAVLKAAGRGLTLSPRAVTIRPMGEDGYVAASAAGAQLGAAFWREGEAVVAVACSAAWDVPSQHISRSEM